MQRVVRNSAWNVVGEASGGALLFVSFVLVARYLGLSQFGIFSYIVAVVGVLQVVADFGLTTILVRDMARDRSAAADMFAAAATLVTGISLFVLALAAAFAYWWSPAPHILYACLVMGGAAALAYQSLVFAGACRAYEDMGYNAAANAMHKVALLAAIVAAIHLDGGLLGIALAYLGANAAQLVFFYVVVQTNYFPVRWRLVPPYWRHLAVQAIPVGAAMVCRRCTVYAGTLLLGLMASPREVGLFNAALRIMQIFEMLPSTLAAPLLAPFSRLASESQRRFHTTLADTMRIFAVLGLPLLSWILLLAPALIRSTFGPEFAEAAGALRIMSVATFMFFPTSLYACAFVALRRQAYYAAGTMVCLAVTVALNVALVPFLADRGAAAAIVAGEVSFFVCGYLLLRRAGFAMSLLTLYWKPTLATAIASSVLLSAMDDSSLVSIALHSVAYGVAYVLLAALLRVLRPEELVALRAGLRPRPNA